MLVTAMTGKRFVVYTDDDMAKRYGSEATITREHQEASIDAPAGNFDRTFDNSAFRAEGKRDERKEQAHECGRQRPGVSSNDKNATHESFH